LLQFSVTDTGASIAAEELGNVFEPFAQTRYGAASGEGTGLELALSREYAQLLGGSLTVDSGPDQGCTFRLVVPVELTEFPVSVD
jgi:signal transduction histidine kinase